MVVLGTDTHKRSHTVVAVDEAGAEIGSMTVAATPEGHLRLVKWAAKWPQRRCIGGKRLDPQHRTVAIDRRRHMDISVGIHPTDHSP